MAECLAIQSLCMAQVLECEVAESGVGVSQLGDAFAQVRHASFTPRMQLVQHGHHLMPDPVAFQRLVSIAGIQSDRQLQTCTDVRCVSASELQEGPPQPGAIG